MLPAVMAVALVVASCSSGGGDGDGGASGSASEGEASAAPDPSSPESTAPTDGDFTFQGEQAAPDFPAGLTWFNVERPLSLAQDLRGKVVLLDFWTQGCINCLHVIPDLERLEEEFAEELVVVGVHWAKFDRERTDEAIAQAVRRNGVTHPVVNDAASQVAESYGARAWPTLILIDPDGRVVGGHAGEGAYDVFHDPIATMVDEFGAAGRIDETPLGDLLARPAPSPAVLNFPGDVLADEAGGRLFIADTGRDRILEATLAGELVRAIGTGEPGLLDGPVAEAQFRAPQGLSLSDDGATLYVADRENHAVRAVDLAAGMVTTIAGTGGQGAAVTRDRPATEVAVPSPWDVLAVGDSVYVAGAGRHQLYRVDLASGTLERFAGSGAEGIDDGDPLEATLSQPSGLATDGEWLWFTDPEASAVRRLPLDGSGELETVVGTGLFDWGDTVGPLAETRLQHATGIEIVNDFVVVADTYNHRLKVLDPAGGQSQAWAGDGTSGFRDGVPASARFAEPAGLSATSTTLYVADTNNHQIRTVDTGTAEVGTLELTNLDVAAQASIGQLADEVRLPPQQVAPGPVTIEIGYELPDGYKLNAEGTFTMEWTAEGGALAPAGPADLAAKAPELPVRFEAVASGGETVVQASGTVYYCLVDNEGFCLVRDVSFEVPVEVVDGAGSTVTATHALPDGEALGIGMD
jgi:sugar lactone lactonase YvrE